MKTFNSQTLHGLWAAVPTPFQDAQAIDYDVLQENCRRLQGAGVDGIYTTDSDGEFYAIELPEFQTLAERFGRMATELGFDAQMGVTWANTRGVIDRIKASVDAGITTVHVALPFFMPLPVEDVYRFFDDLAAAAPSARWIYYAHPNCLPLLKGRELARLAASHPEQFIGTKLNAYELSDLTDVFLHTPQLSHFVGERNLLFGCLLGAKGCYSYWVNTMPAWTRTFFDACRDGDHVMARAMHLKLYEWEVNGLGAIRQKGYRHGIMGKARGHLREFLLGDGTSRPPYSPVSPELITDLKLQFDAFWQTELGQEGLLVPPTRNTDLK